MGKAADTDHPIHSLLAERWSPYAFADRDVADEDLRCLFEAARWAPPSYNGQPWSYVVATRARPEGFERLLSCLVEGNQVWARHAPVLALGITRHAFVRNGKPNAAAEHDDALVEKFLEEGELSYEEITQGIQIGVRDRTFFPICAVSAMHGGVGMTDEFDIGFYMKRARVAELTFGDAAHHRDRWARLSEY